MNRYFRHALPKPMEIEYVHYEEEAWVEKAGRNEIEHDFCHK